MGIDISGWVEVREGGSWQSVVTVWPILARNYYMYKFVLGAWKEPGMTSIDMG